MADAVAGAILIELKAQAAELNKQFERAKTVVESFGQGVVKTAQQVTTASERMTSTLSAMAAVSNNLQKAKTFFVEGAQSLSPSLNAIAQASKRAAAGSMEMDNAFVRNLLTLRQLSRQVNTTTGALTENFRTIDQGLESAFGKSDAKHSAKIANLVSRLLSIQFAMQQLGDGSQRDASDFGRGLDIASKSLSTFAVILSIMPNKIGLVAGGIGAAATAISGLIGPTQEAIEAAQKLKDKLTSIREELVALEERGKASNLRRDLNLRFPLAEPTREEATQSATLEERNRLEDKFVKLSEGGNKLLEDRLALHKRLKEAEERAFDLTGLFRESAQSVRQELEKNRKEIEANNKALGETEEAFKRTTTNARNFTETVEQAQKRQSLVKGIKEQLEGITVQLAANQEAVKAGLVDPLEAAKKEADLLLQRALAIKQFKAALAELPAEIRSKITFSVPDGDQAARDAAAEQATKEFLRGQDELDRERALKRKEEQDRRTEDLASGLSRSIGDGVTQGIMQGLPAMEILANTGQNLFSNFLSKSVDKFETAMIDAFKSIGGAGGEILGGALTAALGIAGGIFANRKSKSTESFSGVRSVIESSQVVRGVVAGPSSVAVATVSEDISRSVAPLVDLNRVMAQLLSRIERNTRGGGGPANAGGSDIVAVPTA